MVTLSTIIPKKTVQLKSFPIEKSSLDSDVIAGPKPAGTIDIRPASVVGKRNQDPLFGLIAHFEGIALEVYLLHPSIHCLDSGSRSGRFAATLIPIPDVCLDAD
jgi:hypothetical protein